MGFALSYDSPLAGGERESSPGEVFHAPRLRSWEWSAVVLPGTPRADVWGGRGTGVRLLGAGWRAVECRALRCTVVRVERIAPLARERSHVLLVRHVFVILLSLLIVLSRSSSCCLFSQIIHSYCRSERGIANKHTAQHRAITSAQVPLGTVLNCFLSPIMDLFFLPPSRCILHCASVAGGSDAARGGKPLSSQYYCCCDVPGMYDTAERQHERAERIHGQRLRC